GAASPQLGPAARLSEGGPQQAAAGFDEIRRSGQSGCSFLLEKPPLAGSRALGYRAWVTNVTRNATLRPPGGDRDASRHSGDAAWRRKTTSIAVSRRPFSDLSGSKEDGFLRHSGAVTRAALKDTETLWAIDCMLEISPMTQPRTP